MPKGGSQRYRSIKRVMKNNRKITGRPNRRQAMRKQVASRFGRPVAAEFKRPF